MPRLQGGGVLIDILGCITGSSTGLAHLYTDWLNHHWCKEMLEDYLQLQRTFLKLTPLGNFNKIMLLALQHAQSSNKMLMKVYVMTY